MVLSRRPVLTQTVAVDISPSLRTEAIMSVLMPDRVIPSNELGCSENLGRLGMASYTVGWA